MTRCTHHHHHHKSRQSRYNKCTYVLGLWGFGLGTLFFGGGHCQRERQCDLQPRPRPVSHSLGLDWTTPPPTRAFRTDVSGGGKGTNWNIGKNFNLAPAPPLLTVATVIYRVFGFQSVRKTLSGRCQKRDEALIIPAGGSNERALMSDV